MKKLIELRKMLSLLVIIFVANSCFALKKFAETPAGQILPGTAQDILRGTMDKNGNLPLAGVDYVSPSTGQQVRLWINGSTIRNYSGITPEEINQLELMDVSEIRGSFKNSGADPASGSIVPFGAYGLPPSGMQHIGIKKTGRVFFKGNCLNYQVPLQAYTPETPKFEYVPPAPKKEEEYVPPPPPSPPVVHTNTVIKETIYVYKEPQTMNALYQQQPLQQCCPEVRQRDNTGWFILGGIVLNTLMQPRYTSYQPYTPNQPVQWAGTMSNAGSTYDPNAGTMSNGGSSGWYSTGGSSNGGGISNGGSSNSGGNPSGSWTIIPRVW